MTGPDSVSTSPDGWPTRAAVVEAWQAVIVGTRRRDDAHEWAARWIEGIAGDTPPADPLIESGLQYLHGLDMTIDPTAPSVVFHGGPRPYLLADEEVQARLTHWQQTCRDYDADPAGHMRPTAEQGRLALEAELRRTSSPDTFDE